MTPGWTTMRAYVTPEYMTRIEGMGGGLPKVGARERVTVGGVDLGEWTVESVEYTMNEAGGYTLPAYWVTFGREMS